MIPQRTLATLPLVETPTPGLGMTICRHSRPTQPTPAVFEPKVYLLLRGRSG